MGGLELVGLVLLGGSTGALLLAERLPGVGPVRGRLYPLTVGGLSAVCIGASVQVAWRFDPRTGLLLACSGALLGLAGRRRYALLVAERDRLVRRVRAGRAARGL